MRTAAVLLLALTLAACSSDADRADNLRHYLADQWSFSPDYAAIKDAKVTYANGSVTLATQLYTEYTQGQELCGWVSSWLYDGDNGASNSAVRVLNRDGEVLSQRHHINDVCSLG